jgi:hypothetical protein
VGIKQFWFSSQKHAKYRRFSRCHDGREIWLAKWLVNGAQGQLQRHSATHQADLDFMILTEFRVAKATLVGECPAGRIALSPTR